MIESSTISQRTLSVKKINDAKLMIISHIQSHAFSEEIESLKQNQPIKKSSCLFRLDSFLKDSLLRVGGRIKFEKLAYCAKHPILVPKTSPITALIVRDAHCLLGHVGRQHLLEHIRINYWIIHANAVVRKVLSEKNNFNFCRKKFKQPESQKMPDLPE